MSKSKVKILTILAALQLTLSSCSQGNEEGAIAKNISLSTSKVSIVLPNDLKDANPVQTCTAGGVTGPRVRMKASIKWSGTEGDLLPLVIRLISTDSRLASKIEAAISPSKSDTESLAYMFDGVLTDFLPGGTDTTYTTSLCFLDYGSLPKPLVELKGGAQLEIPVTISMTGIVRNADGDDTPFVKEINTTITYVAGSVPVK